MTSVPKLQEDKQLASKYWNMLLVFLELFIRLLLHKKAAIKLH